MLVSYRNNCKFLVELCMMETATLYYFIYFNTDRQQWLNKKNENAFVGSKCSWLMLLELFSLFQPCNLNAFRMPLLNTQFIFAFSYFRNALLTLFHFTISHNFPIVHTISEICWWCVAKKENKNAQRNYFPFICSFCTSLLFLEFVCCFPRFVLFRFVCFEFGFSFEVIFFYFRSTWISYTKFHHTHSKIGHYTPHRTTNMSKHQ